MSETTRAYAEGSMLCLHGNCPALSCPGLVHPSDKAIGGHAPRGQRLHHSVHGAQEEFAPGTEAWASTDDSSDGLQGSTSLLTFLRVSNLAHGSLALTSRSPLHSCPSAVGTAWSDQAYTLLCVAHERQCGGGIRTWIPEVDGPDKEPCATAHGSASGSKLLNLSASQSLFVKQEMLG